MGNIPKDWDITTSALPLDVKKIFSHTVDTGIKHGTVTVIRNRVNYEVTTYRVDGEYTDSRRPSQVSFTLNIQEDLSRRDFTINAIAYAPDKGFVDPFDGQTDIKQKTIRCVGKAVDRFNEDALRMLRAVRFSAQLGFDIEAKTFDAIIACRKNLFHISAERIRDELTRLLVSPCPEKILLLESSGLLSYMLGEREYGGDLPIIIKKIEECPCQLTLRLVLFFSWTGDSAPQWLRRLRFDNKTIREASTLIRLLPTPIPHDRYQIKKLLSKTSAPTVEGLTVLQQDSTARVILHDIVQSEECFTLRQLAVNGKDLIAIGVASSEQIGCILDNLLDRVMLDPSLNDFDTLIRIIPSLVS
jgi:tRNA nucleotidyltransferase (CCA-adding enzyme)